MRKLTRRILPLFLSLALCLGMVPPAALAADTEPQEGTEACICDTLCTEGGVNADCPVCGAVGADLTQCLGRTPRTTRAPGRTLRKARTPERTPRTPRAARPANSRTSRTAVADMDPNVAAVQAMIDALPTVEELETLSSEELDAAYIEVKNAFETYTALTDEQKAQIIGVDFDALFDVFDSMTTALADNSDVSSGQLPLQPMALIPLPALRQPTLSRSIPA